MKKVCNLGMCAMLSLALMFTACSSDDDSGNSNSNSAIIADVENTVESGSWRITYYFDSTDETSDYNGYTFTFGTNGVLTASNGNNTYSGTWSVTDSSNSSSSSSSDDDIDFNILFSAPPDFEELSDDWEIVRYSSTKIELTDVSGGNGGTDFLTFERQ